MHVMNRMIDSKTESPQSRTKACFILSEQRSPDTVYEALNKSYPRLPRDG
jgi:hypothetical protein